MFFPPYLASKIKREKGKTEQHFFAPIEHLFLSHTYNCLKSWSLLPRSSPLSSLWMYSSCLVSLSVQRGAQSAETCFLMFGSIK